VRRLDGVLAGRVNAFGALPARTREAGARIRLGYLSANFGDHPIGHVTVSLFGAHDRAGFEVHGLSLRDRTGERQPFAARHRAGFDAFHDLSRLSPRATANAILDAEIDILIDLDGYVGQRSAEILAYRPAPLQVVLIAHLGGLDLSCVDYLVTDRIVVPPGEEALHREQLVRLPHTMHGADRHEIGPAPSRAACGLPAAGVVFGAFTRADKLDRAILDAWMRILAAVPGSVLWLAKPPTGTHLEAALRQHATDRGVDPARLVFAERLADKAAHLGRLGRCDLLLDTPAFNAASTAIDALWAGVPVLALQGDRPGSRISASLLDAVGLPDLICGSLEAYERRAIELGQASDALAALRARLAAQRTDAPLFDGAAYARALEAAYAQMWRRYLAGEPPLGFTVMAGDGPAPAPKPRAKAKPKAPPKVPPDPKAKPAKRAPKTR
jgi:protein O-GlcNAc transferase